MDFTNHERHDTNAAEKLVEGEKNVAPGNRIATKIEKRTLRMTERGLRQQT